LNAQKPVGQDPATKVFPEFLFDEIWQRMTGLFLNQAQKGLKIFLHDFVKDGLFRAMPLICEGAKCLCGLHSRDHARWPQSPCADL
jgi:hypothetical protein